MTDQTMGNGSPLDMDGKDLGQTKGSRVKMRTTWRPLREPEAALLPLSPGEFEAFPLTSEVSGDAAGGSLGSRAVFRKRSFMA